MARIDTIVFDLGGVLIDWNPRYVFEKVFNDSEELEFFLTYVCDGTWNAEQDRGRSFSEAIKMKQKEFPQYSQEIPLYFERWTEMISGEISETVEILQEIYSSGKFRLYALTNWSAETFPYAWDNFKFLRLFEGILVSGKEKLIKPDTEIYQLLFRRFDIEPSKSIFIDDSLKNVQTADKVGMNAIHYLSSSQLRETLNSYDIVA